MRHPPPYRTIGSLLAALLTVSCGGADDGPEAEIGESGGYGTSSGGTPTSGGSAAGGSGGVASGGVPATGGLTTGGASTGGLAPTGGASGTGGLATGGFAPTGGASGTGGLATGGLAPTGGATSTGGSATGGLTPTGGASSTGGFATGGLATGGDATGGDGSGGFATGGTDTGGTDTGGTDTGGTDTGGTDTGGAGGAAVCEYPDPPSDVSDWVDESWDAELGANVRGRSAWLFDNVMQGDGELNLCVRWGATSAPSAAMKEKLATSVERWFNDWFTAMGDYGCFPYSDGVSVRITGWAVRAGNEGWVSDLDDSISVYTETDPEGEPKCPDACSFFLNWDHQFSSCPGGDAAHFDYAIWLDDALPGDGGAAAVGGDWGLRMPRSSFEAALDRPSDGVIEHEMGHGFGLQDYYTWEGSRPAGGSIMIVGSGGGSQPTTADVWLLRRTWAEMQELRGW